MVDTLPGGKWLRLRVATIVAPIPPPGLIML